MGVQDPEHILQNCPTHAPGRTCLGLTWRASYGDQLRSYEPQPSSSRTSTSLSESWPRNVWTQKKNDWMYEQSSELVSERASICFSDGLIDLTDSGSFIQQKVVLWNCCTIWNSHLLSGRQYRAWTRHYARQSTWNTWRRGWRTPGWSITAPKWTPPARVDLRPGNCLSRVDLCRRARCIRLV